MFNNVYLKGVLKMEKRDPILVFVFSIITFGIYYIWWLWKTKHEMVDKGADIPTTWLIIIPLADIWWIWKYSQGVEKITSGKCTGVIAFILLFLLGPIGAAILQNYYNEVA